MEAVNIDGNLKGDMHKMVNDVERAKRLQKHIEEIVDKMKKLDYTEFLIMCKMIADSDLATVYVQSKAIAQMGMISLEKLD